MKRRRHSESKHAQRYFACQALARGEAGTCPWPWRPGDILTSIGPVRQPCVLCRVADELQQVCRVAENEEGARERERQIDPRTEYEKLKTTRRLSTLELWALDVYEQADCDIERAVALLPASHPEPEDEPYLEVMLRLMQTRSRGSCLPWFEMRDEVFHRYGLPVTKAPTLAERIRTLPDVCLTRRLDDARNDPREEESAYRALLEDECRRRALSSEAMAPEYLEAAE